MRERKLIYRIATAGALVYHESFHYLVARLLGLPATLHHDYVDVQYRRLDWRAYAVALAPAAATIVLHGWAGWRFAERGLWPLIVIVIVSAMGWLLMCWQDFYDVIYMLRHQAFCTQLAPPLPMFHQQWWDMRRKGGKQMALRQNFGAQLSDPERLKRIAARLGFVQTRGRERGQGSIRQLLEAITAGEATVVVKPEVVREREEDQTEAKLRELEQLGIITRPRVKGKLSPFKPMKVEGEPVSEMIIRERR